MSGNNRQSLTERRRSSVRFSEGTFAPSTTGVSDGDALRRSFRDRPSTPAASMLPGAYFPSPSDNDTPFEEAVSDVQRKLPASKEPSVATSQPGFKSNNRLRSASESLHTRPQGSFSQKPKHDFESNKTDLAVEYFPQTSLPTFQPPYTLHASVPQPPSNSIAPPSHQHHPDALFPGRPPLSRANEGIIQNSSPRRSTLDGQPPSYPERTYYNHDYRTSEYTDQALVNSLQPAPPVSSGLPQSNTMYDSGEGFRALRDEARRDSDIPHQRGDLESGYPAINLSGVDDPAGRGDPRHRTSQPAKPSLRRATTEDVVEKEPNRKAADIVGSHIKRRRGKSVGNTGLKPPLLMEDFEDVDEFDTPPPASSVKGGVLSHLLELYGNNRAGPIERSGSATSATTYAGGSVATSRQTSVDSRVANRRVPFVSPWDSNEKMYSHSPPKSSEHGDHAKSSKRNRKARDSDGAESDGASVRSTYSVKTFREVVGAVQEKFHHRKTKSRERRATITRHVADILKRQNFILKLAKALMTTGAPSHRLESQLSATARVLEIDAQFVHLPSIVIATFGDADTRTSETHFVKANGGIDLGQLHRVHHVYKSVVHDHTGVGQGSAALHKILNESPLYSPWQRMVIAFFCCGTIAILGFAGSFVDGWVAGAFGSFLAFMQLKASTNQMYSSIFEISVATIVSFISRGLSTTNYFCYESLSSAGVVLILPGYIILCGSLELASKNLIAGSVKMVYAVIYSLFLGFGISIGSDFYYLLDPKARHNTQMQQATQSHVYTLSGSFNGMNGTIPGMIGDFTFSNGTAGVTGEGELHQGRIQCYREPHWEWWRQPASPYWSFLLVPMFSFFLSLWNLQPIWTKQMPVMVIIACIGWVCNFFANKFIFDRSDVVSFLGAFVIGLLGNMYSRFFKGTAFTSMVTGVLFLVPSGIAAAGGLAMTYHSTSGDSYSNGLIIGFRMVQVAIGITVGLFFSSFVVYSFGSGKSSATFTF
ncbi:hypothetical protein PGT21_032365 [Puccinia graminis f. sp. tritici]|uniref:Threonine/serine exporter-like N-terminal domain-containing protein n=1 Tax=Puccinia graminis f. sp. tritici TaxID=56615 RepID=A0A5B0P8M5_PUCGR|nr:hypothetical protein PGT21_032365 [Puccinia graminis f. sp. tritici]KAA1107902.1 hypothetical protein PGTUg99_006024 [Puccinia graminis f. sp. tritici]